MELDYLNEFLVLTEVVSLSDAAEKLTVSESSLSRHIRALEDELNCSLFDRTCRTLKISACGRTFIPYAREMVSMRQRCLSDIRTVIAQERSTISVINNYYIGDVLSDFLSKNPNIVTNVITGPNDEESVKNRLRKNECTFAFAVDFQDPDGEFNSFVFSRDSYAAVLPSCHPLAGRKSIALEELANERFVSYKANSYHDLAIKEFCRKAGFEPFITGYIGSTLVNIIREGNVIAILLKGILKLVGANLSGIAVVDFDPEISCTVSVVYRKGLRLSCAEKEFLQYCENNRRV